MSSSREDSPDWLRSYQVPNQAAVTLSSGSESPLSDDEDELKLSRLFKKEVSPEKIEDDQVEEESQVNKTLKMQKADQTPGRKRKKELLLEKEEKKAGGGPLETKRSEKPMASSEPNHSVWALSSDSDSCPDSKPVKMDIDCVEKYHSRDNAKKYVGSEKDEGTILDDGGEPPLEVSIMKTPKKKLKKEIKAPTVESVNALKNGGNTGDMDVEEDIFEKRSGPNVSSRLPLVLSEKVQRSKALVECEGDSIDLSGDVGSVGRVVISDGSSGNHEMLLDLKGTVYKTSIVPCRTFCVVSFGQSEAKIEAIMNDFIQLRPQSNVYEAETMVEGTLEGFSFDSEDDVDDLPKSALPNNQNEDAEEQPNGKTKKKTQKASGAAGKKVKTAGGKSAKKLRKKSQAPKKSKTKK